MFPCLFVFLASGLLSTMECLHVPRKQIGGALWDRISERFDHQSSEVERETHEDWKCLWSIAGNPFRSSSRATGAEP